MEEKVIGIKFNIGINKIPKGYSFQDFIDHCTCSTENTFRDEPQPIVLTCKWYDEDTGELYFHFDRPFRKSTVQKLFTKSECINYISN